MGKEASDHALAAIKASISLVPYVGGAIASLIGDYVPSATQRSLNAAIAELKSRLEELEGSTFTTKRTAALRRRSL